MLSCGSLGPNRREACAGLEIHLIASRKLEWNGMLDEVHRMHGTRDFFNVLSPKPVSLLGLIIGREEG